MLCFARAVGRTSASAHTSEADYLRAEATCFQSRGYLMRQRRKAVKRGDLRDQFYVVSCWNWQTLCRSPRSAARLIASIRRAL